MMTKKPQIILTKKLRNHRYNLKPLIIRPYDGPKTNIKSEHQYIDYHRKKWEEQTTNDNLIVPIEEFDLCYESANDVMKLKPDSSKIRISFKSFLKHSKLFGAYIGITSGGAILFCVGARQAPLIFWSVVLFSLLLERLWMFKSAKKFIDDCSSFKITAKKNFQELTQTGKVSGYLFISKNSQNIVWFSNHDLEEIYKIA